MDYFERSQVVKAEIEKDFSLVFKIVAHINDKHQLDFIGGGTMNNVYRVGRLNSGLWVALRENSVYSRNPNNKGVMAYIYNSYCLDAEKYSSRFSPPDFCVCGVSEDKPFLLVEDVTKGGEYSNMYYAGGGAKEIILSKGIESITRMVDIGDDEQRELDNDTRFEMVMGRFNIDSLKYFHPEARLNI